MIYDANKVIKKKEEIGIDERKGGTWNIQTKRGFRS